MTKDIFSNQYWEKAWEGDPNTQDKRMKRAGLGDPSALGFEKWAENFNKILLLKKVTTYETDYELD